MESCSARSDIGMYTPYNVFKLPWSNAFQTLAILTPFCQAARMPNPKATLSCFHQQLKSFLTLPNTHTCPPSTASSCPGASTRAEHLWLHRASLSLSLHCLNKEAKRMKNGLSRSHPSKLGLLSSAFIHFCDLSSIWILGTWYHLLKYF